MLDIEVSLLLKDNLKCVCFYSGVAAWFVESPAALIFVSHLQHKAELEQLFPHGLFTTKSWLELFDFVFYSQRSSFSENLIFLYVHALKVSVVGFFMLKTCLDFSYEEEELH